MIQDRVLKVLGNVFPLCSSLTRESTFKDLKIDPLDLVDFIVELEKEFGLEIDDNFVTSCQSLEEIIQYLENECTKKI